MPSVLVVDDEPRIATLAKDYLTRAGFSVAVAADGATGLEMARQKRPDLIVLDLGLPGLDGLELARTLRRESDVPIIMLTARVDEADRLHGFEVGADDYITKPFSPRELVARVSSVLRRARYDQARRVLPLPTSIDAAGMRVEAKRHATQPHHQFQLLSALARRRTGLHARSCWMPCAARGESSAPSMRVKNVAQARARSASPRYLLTVYGIGYKFAEVAPGGGSIPWPAADVVADDEPWPPQRTRFHIERRRARHRTQRLVKHSAVGTSHQVFAAFRGRGVGGGAARGSVVLILARLLRTVAFIIRRISRSARRSSPPLTASRTAITVASTSPNSVLPGWRYRPRVQCHGEELPAQDQARRH